MIDILLVKLIQFSIILRIFTLSFLYNTFEKKNFHQMLIKHQLHRNALIKQIFLAFFFLNNL